MVDRDDDLDASGTDPDLDEGGDDSALHVATEGESWRFSLEDLEEDEDAEEITPGSPSLEDAVFVLLGVAVTTFVIVQLVL
jgi:hypothetical protein